MSQIITNANQVADAMRQAVKESVAQVEEATAELLFKLRTSLKYPPPPPGSSYTRTGALLTGIRGGPIGTKSTTDGHVMGIYKVLNPGYAYHVIDVEGQAWMHEGRWWYIQFRAVDLAEDQNFERKVAMLITNKVNDAV